jgi:hypothetical protein
MWTVYTSLLFSLIDRPLHLSHDHNDTPWIRQHDNTCTDTLRLTDTCTDSLQLTERLINNKGCYFSTRHAHSQANANVFTLQTEVNLQMQYDKHAQRQKTTPVNMNYMGMYGLWAWTKKCVIRKVISVRMCVCVCVCVCVCACWKMVDINEKSLLRRYNNPIPSLDRTWVFQEVEAPRLQDKVTFLLDTESTPGPVCGRKDYVNEKSERNQSGI